MFHYIYTMCSVLYSYQTQPERQRTMLHGQRSYIVEEKLGIKEKNTPFAIPFFFYFNYFTCLFTFSIMFLLHGLIIAYRHCWCWSQATSQSSIFLACFVSRTCCCNLSSFLIVHHGLFSERGNRNLRYSTNTAQIQYNYSSDIVQKRSCTVQI